MSESRTVLIVVDIQNDFCPGGALAVKDGDGVVEPGNKIVEFAYSKYWLVIASQDWHPKDSGHFKKWPVHCVQYTWGAEFHHDLRVGAYAIIVKKGRLENEDGYSAFDGKTDLGNSIEKIFKNCQVKKVYIFGLATDYCVKCTALDAAKKGFKVFLMLDACRAVNREPGDEERAIEEMKAVGVIMTTTDEVLRGEV